MARKGGILGALAAAQRPRSEADAVADDVRKVAEEITPVTRQGFLFFAATTQFLAERMAIPVCREHNVPLDRYEDVAGYLTAALQEYATALVGDFDAEHFDAWIAAQEEQAGL